MSKRANPTMVGAFIVAGLALTIGGIVLFGSFRWFAPSQVFIIYFEDSAAGLEAGSPVKLRGVPVGRVKEVLIHYNQATNDLYLPVLVEIEQHTLAEKIDTQIDLRDPRQLERFVKEGLRAKLVLESFVTGRLLVDLAFDTNAPPPVFHQLKSLYPEIPSTLTELSALRRNIAKVDIAGIAERVETLLDKLHEVLSELRVREIFNSTMGTLDSIRGLVQSPKLTNTLNSIQAAADQFRSLSQTLEDRVDPLAKDARRTLTAASDALDEASLAIAELRGVIAIRSPLRVELDTLLTDLAEAANSVAALAEMLRRNPQALLQGRERSSP